MESFGEARRFNPKEAQGEKYGPADIRKKFMSIPEPLQKQLDLVLQNKYNLDFETVSSESTLTELTDEAQRTQLASIIADVHLNQSAAIPDAAARIAKIVE